MPPWTKARQFYRSSYYFRFSSMNDNPIHIHAWVKYPCSEKQTYSCVHVSGFWRVVVSNDPYRVGA